MKILLVSDTHGRMDRLFNISRNFKDVDMIIHLGDNYQDAIELSEKHAEYEREMIYVAGNTDGFFESKELSKVVETPYGNIYICHGHKESVNSSLMNLYYKTVENDCIAGCFGHTHIPAYEDLDGVKLLNPGSLSKPRNMSKGNYGIITLDENGIDFEICEYKDEKKESKAGGYIRGIINYSDRF